MKNFLKISLAAAMFLTAGSVHANDDFTLKVKSEKEKTIRFFINEAKDVNLSIHAVSGINDEVLFEEQIHASGVLTKTYDLNELPNGSYVVKIESGSKLATYQVEISNNKASVSEPTMSDIFKPDLTQEGGLVILNLENTDKSPIEVEVLDEYNQQLYSETFKDQSSLSKKFNVAHANTDALTFVVKHNNQMFVKTLAKL